MQQSFERIIIIGGSSGMGRRLAELYAEDNCRVGITGRRESLLEEVKSKYPSLIEIAVFDVTQKKNIQPLAALADRLGGLDILIISAGGGRMSASLDWEIDKQTVETNVMAFVEIANWGFNWFVNQGRGRLAVISSIASNRGNSGAPAYSASKAFQSIYMEGLHMKARRLKKNIGITCIEPGLVNDKSGKSFWVVPVDKAARQIKHAIKKKKKIVYVSKRWGLVAWMAKWIPYAIYRRIM